MKLEVTTIRLSADRRVPEWGVISRRSLLSSTASAAALVPVAGVGQFRPATEIPQKIMDPQTAVSFNLTVNNRARHLTIDPRTTLLDALREHLGLTGAKKGCDHGQCGACTVLVDGARVLACLTLAVAVRGPVSTIEGLSEPGGSLHPMQQAFIDQDAFQCGYCTPGQIISAIGCINEGHARNDVEIREHMSGNLCRCAAYPHIVKAINQAKSEMRS
jgi:xanthine dehydrogenase YagT iron-sulfur-binding subunit